MAPSPRGDREVAKPYVEEVVLSPYHVDAFGRPRALSKTEAFFYACAKPVLVGVIIIFSVAIAVAATQHVSVSSTPGLSQSPSNEAAR